ncbi:MAG: hypothetical protein IPL12_09925 [Bacteroidetes bacterium]|nr:hypothetical protein [Bacteroidota bacterium]
MKKIYQIAFFVAFVTLLNVNGNSQVVMKDYLVANHEGVVEKSVNNLGNGLYYKFEYVSTEGARINYKLHLYKDKAMKTPWMSFDVLMRNLNWTYYVDITMSKDGADKVAAMIFKKDLRWSRVKYSPHPGCLRMDPPVYERYTIGAETESAEVLFAGLLNNFIVQLDKNVDFNCYAPAK